MWEGCEIVGSGWMHMKLRGAHMVGKQMLFAVHHMLTQKYISQWLVPQKYKKSPAIVVTCRL